MKLFWLEIKKEVKDYQIPYSTAYTQWILNNGQDIQLNMQTFYKMYRIDSDIRRCIQEIMQTAGKSGWIIREWINNRQDYKQIKNQQINEMLWSDNFNTLKNEIIKHLEISWNVFILKGLNLEDKAVDFKILDCRYISIVTDSNLNVVRYLYKDIKKNVILTYMPDDVYHYIDTIDPDNTVFWISLLETIVYDVMGDIEASKSNYYFFQNDALPSSLYILQEWLTTEAQEQILNNLKTQLQGWHNKHKNIVSWNIVDVKPIAQSHTDMDFLNQKKHKTEKVCATMGVPRIILNYTDWVNYSNAETQYKKFIENTVRPIEQTLTVIFNELFKDYLGDAEFYIVDQHINDLSEKLDLAIKWVAIWLITRNEWRQFMWYESAENNDIMNEYTCSSNTILLDAVAWTVATVDNQTTNNPNDVWS